MAQTRTRRPLIGVTAGTSTLMQGAWAGHEAVILTEHYVRALREAGARAVIIAAQDEWTDEEIAELDGLVLTGGTDLDPALYGEELRETGFAPDAARDAFETALYRSARRAGVPVLGICRGLQLIAVAEGGDLHAHLPADLPAHPVTGLAPTAVRARIEPDSDLALALGTSADVTAFHHQGVRRVPASLRAVARHESSLVLGLEARSGSPVLAVQWHPELEGAGGGVFARLLEVIALQGLPAGAGIKAAQAGLR
ncbi:gamma-glutamyl-gamma-aminobutyrate hydrolase family protein [Brachybacterium sp. JHP9]|uniref:Gamma-glutamyl-gamma-aminobutyrate hydrolase family protein n=1 Tax=Brachybacterium equifaecis TaxID=2910770 RepID=A0ABT0QW41_9MICO|nr:gamma-glutamyl-gamma-aminobutyrate hydrolase family protein [Brachybacterium equifaecis]MCL6421874.1 gamma-glutamyl-gamma-aminobutyrate hydrolase family protein [Brachybacterium equifaecis]